MSSTLQRKATFGGFPSPKRPNYGLIHASVIIVLKKTKETLLYVFTRFGRYLKRACFRKPPISTKENPVEVGNPT